MSVRKFTMLTLSAKRRSLDKTLVLTLLIIDSRNHRRIETFFGTCLHFFDLIRNEVICKYIILIKLVGLMQMSHMDAFKHRRFSNRI